jgi:hypothetical protein
MNPEMSVESAGRASRQRIALWELFFLLVFSAAVAGAAVWQSHKTYLNNDELVTAVVVAEPSYGAMIKAIAHGGELNPPLFFSLEWFVAHTLGTSELALRAISIVSTALAGCVLFLTLRGLAGPWLAAVAVAMVFGLSREAFGFAAIARYYALLLLLVCVAVNLALRPDGEERCRRWRYAAIFLTHCSMAYLHLYGLLYSGVILVAMAMSDWLQRKARWGTYFSVLAAWASFVAWIPCMRQQLKSVSGGVYVPENMLELGFFLEQLTMGIPMALVLILSVFLAGLALACGRSSVGSEGDWSGSSPRSWLALLLLAFGLMAVPASTWIASHWMYPPPYMLRYSFPIVAGWTIIIGFILSGAHRLSSAGNVLVRVPPFFWKLGWVGALAVCTLFQPLRARKSPPLPAAPFTDEDFGHPNLPIVFENSYFYLQRAWYGREREYVMLIDQDAAEADPGWYTKNMAREFKPFSPRYGKLMVLDWDHLPDWPQGFIAVDDDYTKTFEWLFAHAPGVKKELLGTVQWEPTIFGQQRIYWVHKNK